MCVYMYVYILEVEDLSPAAPPLGVPPRGGQADLVILIKSSSNDNRSNNNNNNNNSSSSSSSHNNDK